MDVICIEPTEETPLINCSNQGKISVSGKSLTEDPYTFYSPIQSWVEQLKSEEIVMDLSLDYMNTASSKQIFTLIELAHKNQTKRNLTINWYYEASDEDSIDIGKEFEMLLEIPFNFIVQS